jgi:hypothetical protein
MELLGITRQGSNGVISVDEYLVSRLLAANNVITGLHGHEDPYPQFRNLKAIRRARPPGRQPRGRKRRTARSFQNPSGLRGGSGGILPQTLNQGRS